MRLLSFYLVVGLLICLWFSIATAKGWRAIDTGILNSGGTSTYGGRGYGGSWGGGK